MIVALACVPWTAALADEPAATVPDQEASEYRNHAVDAGSGRFRPGKGLEWASEDGKFSIALGLRAMFLYEVDHDPSADAGERTTQQIMIRRARITASGSMWGKANRYKVELAVSPRDEAVDRDGDVTQTPLLTWQNSFTQLRDFEVRIGQYKVPYSRERVVSSSKLAMVDRSATNSEFSMDRDIGFDVGSRDLGGLGLLQVHAGVFAGEGRGRFEPGDFGLMYLARVEVTPLGKFKDYEPQDFARTGPRLSVGAGWALVDKPTGAKDILDGAPDGTRYAYHNLTGDVLFKAGGFSTEAAFFWRDGGPDDREFAAVGTGFYAQPAILIPHAPVGIAVRYGSIMPASQGTMERRSEAGGGISYYFSGARNHMKVQADLLRTWGVDIAAGELQGRLQLQAML